MLISATWFTQARSHVYFPIRDFKCRAREGYKFNQSATRGFKLFQMPVFPNVCGQSPPAGKAQNSCYSIRPVIFLPERKQKSPTVCIKTLVATSVLNPHLLQFSWESPQHGENDERKHNVMEKFPINCIWTVYKDEPSMLPKR